MERKVQILSIKKNEIVLKSKNKRRKFFIMPIIFISFFILCFATDNSLFGEFRDNIIKAYNPVNSLYNDNSKTIFTSGDLFEKDATNLTLPIKGASYEINSNGTIDFVVGNSIMVMACDSGRVDRVNTSLDGKKYVEISHKNGIKTIVIGVDIVGVNVGDIVKSGQDIATVNIGKKISLEIFQNDVQVTNLKIIKSKIVWEN